VKAKKAAVLFLLIVNVLLCVWLAFLLAGAQDTPQTAIQAPESVIHTVTDFSVADVAAVMIKHSDASCAIMQSGD